MSPLGWIVAAALAFTVALAILLAVLMDNEL